VRVIQKIVLEGAEPVWSPGAARSLCPAPPRRLRPTSAEIAPHSGSRLVAGLGRRSFPACARPAVYLLATREHMGIRVASRSDSRAGADATRRRHQGQSRSASTRSHGAASAARADRRRAPRPAPPRCGRRCRRDGSHAAGRQRSGTRSYRQPWLRLHPAVPQQPHDWRRKDRLTLAASALSARARRTSSTGGAPATRQRRIDMRPAQPAGAEGAR
jgi:hypothetical protein